MRMQTEHKGIEIYFDENTEKWCSTGLAIESASLKGAKAAIDRWDKRRRSSAAVDCYYIGGQACADATISGIAGPGYDRAPRVRYALREGDSRLNMDRLGAFAPQSSRQQIDAWLAQVEVARAESKKSEEMKAAIPRLVPSDVAALAIPDPGDTE